MENLKIEDLIEGEIYRYDYTNKYAIAICSNSKTTKTLSIVYSDNQYYKSNTVSEHKFKKATEEEKHWLRCSIKENKFVPYEKAMETFNNETFAIEINSQEDLDACMEYYKSLGYKETGASHNYDKSFNWVKIDTKTKHWQTVFKHSINGLPLKTLKELGINQQNTQQYEVGRWYKLTSSKCHLGKPWYIKYKGFFNDIHTATDYISQYSGFNRTERSNFGENGDYTFTLLENLNEIQEFLPESHLDKLVKQEPKQSYKYEVVHCQTKEEWNFVREKTTKINSQEWEQAIKQYSEGIALVFNGSSWGGLNYFKQNNSLIYSFNEWCNKFGHSPDFMNKKQEIPEYLEVLQGFFCEKDPIGKIYKTTEAFPIHLEHCQKLNWEEAYLKNQSCFKSSTKEAYEAQFKVYPLTPEECFNNETIEIGDEVEVTEQYRENDAKVGKKGIVVKIDNNSDIKYCIRNETFQKQKSSWCMNVKLISKAKNNTTHVNKKVDSPLPINKASITTLLRFEDGEEDLFDTSIKKIKSIKTELVEI